MTCLKLTSLRFFVLLPVFLFPLSGAGTVIVRVHEQSFDRHPYVERTVFKLITDFGDGRNFVGAVFSARHNHFVTSFQNLVPNKNQTVDWSRKVSETYFFVYNGIQIPFEYLISLDPKSNLAILGINDNLYESLMGKISSVSIKPLEGLKNKMAVSTYGFSSLTGDLMTATSDKIYFNPEKDAKFFHFFTKKSSLSTNGSPVFSGREAVGVVTTTKDNFIYGVNANRVLQLTMGHGYSGFDSIGNILHAVEYLRKEALINSLEAHQNLIQIDDSFSFDEDAIEAKIRTSHRKKIVLTDLLGTRRIKNGRIEKAISLFKQFPNPISFFHLGTIYENQKDMSNAVTYYKKSALSGYSPAFLKLGLIEYEANHIKHFKDLLSQAAIRGNKEAQYYLGAYHFFYEKNLDQAQELWTLSANQNYKPAQNGLALIYKMQKKDDESLQILKQSRNLSFNSALNFLRRINGAVNKMIKSLEKENLETQKKKKGSKKLHPSKVNRSKTQNAGVKSKTKQDKILRRSCLDVFKM